MTTPRDAAQSRPHTDLRTRHIAINGLVRPPVDAIFKWVTHGFRQQVHTRQVTVNSRSLDPQTGALTYTTRTVQEQDLVFHNQSYTPQTDKAYKHITAL